MIKCEFEFFECNGRALFSPLNEGSKKLCSTARRKNLVEKDLQYYLESGAYEVTIYPRISFSKDILKRVSYKLQRDESLT